MRIRLGAVLAALALTGCVSANTNMLDERTAIISGRGSAFNSSAQVQQKVLFEAATTAQARGFRYFVILSSADRSVSGTIYVPGQTTTTGTATSTCTGSYCAGVYQGNSYTSPGTMTDFVKPGQDVRVRFFREGQINSTSQGVWDAVSILAAQQ